MPEALADLIQTANSKSLTEKVKKAAKMAGFSRLFSPMSSNCNARPNRRRRTLPREAEE